MKKSIVFSLILLLFTGCQPDPVAEVQRLPDYKIIQTPTYHELISQIGIEKLGRAVEKPNAEGALGRNKDGYFHVRFQLRMTALTDFALISQRQDALAFFIQSLEFAFAHQLSEGDFQFVPPDAILNQPDYSPPTEGDLASGVAFFSSSLGTSLLSLQSSEWFMTDPELDTIRQAVAQQASAYTRLLHYLLAKKDILLAYDAAAPNRLLFDAIAFYSLGTYLAQPEAQQLGLQFLSQAIDQIDGTEGYFIEGGGWDSSYNGVAIKLAMEMLSILPSHQTERLQTVITAATNWQISRIQSDGRISQAGNTRVFPGGERFLGMEKQIDYAQTVKALHYFSSFTASPELVDLGEKVLAFYQ
ncbi:MAG: hypothetical protein AAF206_01270 [Bacteroidota bacterium]